MEKLSINVLARETTGKGAARTLRREGNIPAVVYRAGDSSALTMNLKEFKLFLKAAAGNQVLVDLQSSDKTSKLALLKDYHIHPVSGDILHVDFQEITLDETVKIKVHVTTMGDPIGVKRDKGILQHVLRQVEVECLPNNIPGHLEIDIEELLENQSVHVSDLVAPEGVTILTDLKEVLALVAPAPVEEVIETEEEGEEGEETTETEDSAESEESKED